jgi:hypothetical protein
MFLLPLANFVRIVVEHYNISSSSRCSRINDMVNLVYTIVLYYGSPKTYPCTITGRTYYKISLNSFINFLVVGYFVILKSFEVVIQLLLYKSFTS